MRPRSYKRVCPSVGRSVGRSIGQWVGWSVGRSVGRSVGHTKTRKIIIFEQKILGGGTLDKSHVITLSYNYLIIMRTHRWPYGPCLVTDNSIGYRGGIRAIRLSDNGQRNFNSGR